MERAKGEGEISSFSSGDVTLMVWGGWGGGFGGGRKNVTCSHRGNVSAAGRAVQEGASVRPQRREEGMSGCVTVAILSAACVLTPRNTLFLLARRAASSSPLYPHSTPQCTLPSRRPCPPLSLILNTFSGPSLASVLPSPVSTQHNSPYTFSPLFLFLHLLRSVFA